MNRSLILILVVSALAFTSSPVAKPKSKKPAPAEAADNIVSQKQELERIRKEVESGRKRLDSLKASQLKMQQEISGYDERIVSQKKVITRLSKALGQVTQDIKSAELQLSTHQQSLEMSRKRYVGNLRQFYLASRRQPAAFTINPNAELAVYRQVVYLSALAQFESGSIASTSQLLGESQAALSELTSRQGEISALKKKQESSFSLEKSRKQKQEKALDRLRRRTSDEADKLVTLEQAARDMEKIMARLETERLRKEQEAPRVEGPSFFATLRGRLQMPIRGKIAGGFGNKVDPVTHLKSFSPGITIQAKAGGVVSSVAAGTVAYAGYLRGYGDFVIISHDNQYYSTYAGLDRIAVSEGQYLAERTAIGVAGSDGTVKFELRRGREPLDPLVWIDLDRN